jgi:hypothetical protein
VRISLFDRKVLFIKHRSIFIAILLLSLAAVLITNRARADIQLLSHSSPSFSFSDCMAVGGSPSQCLSGGNVTTSIILSLPDNYTGLVTNSDVLGYTQTASGIGTDSNLTDLGAGFTFSNGLPTPTLGEVQSNNFTLVLRADDAPLDYDEGAFFSGGVLTKLGIVLHPPFPIGSARNYWVRRALRKPRPTARPSRERAVVPIR